MVNLMNLLPTYTRKRVEIHTYALHVYIWLGVAPRFTTTTKRHNSF
jgi:hypothetical protein